MVGKGPWRAATRRPQAATPHADWGAQAQDSCAPTRFPERDGKMQSRATLRTDNLLLHMQQKVVTRITTAVSEHSTPSAVLRLPKAVELGILPGGLSCGLRNHFHVRSCQSRRQDAVLYVGQD